MERQYTPHIHSFLRIKLKTINGFNDQPQHHYKYRSILNNAYLE